MNPNTTFVRTHDGEQLFYKDWGQGKPVVFLATRAQSSDMWQYQMMQMIPHGLRCVAYDRRGHGRSSQPSHGYDYDTLADDLAALLEQLDLREVTLVGHSMGGGEIVRYLSRHGSKRIAGVVFLATITPFLMQTLDNPDGFPQEILEATATAIGADFPKWCGDILDAYFAPDTSPQMKQWSLSMAMETTVLAALELDHEIAKADFRAELARVNVPSLVIAGDKDIYAPTSFCSGKTAQLIPGCRLQVYEGGPHGFPLTHVKRLSGDLLTFVQRGNVRG